MRVELGTSKVNLPPEQAISLAMALHELCYNAIVHGLGEAGGSVTLRTRLPAEGRLAVDVIDTGRGLGEPSAAENGNGLDGGGNGNDEGRGTGIGLELVRGLVSRELRGNFSLNAAPTGGGTVATVEFPVQGVRLER
jgi:two-component sensor histidine kinase